MKTEMGFEHLDCIGGLQPYSHTKMIFLIEMKLDFLQPSRQACLICAGNPSQHQSCSEEVQTESLNREVSGPRIVSKHNSLGLNPVFSCTTLAANGNHGPSSQT